MAKDPNKSKKYAHLQKRQEEQREAAALSEKITSDMKESVREFNATYDPSKKPKRYSRIRGALVNNRGAIDSDTVRWLVTGGLLVAACGLAASVIVNSGLYAKEAENNIEKLNKHISYTCGLYDFELSDVNLYVRSDGSAQLIFEGEAGKEGDRRKVVSTFDVDSDKVDTLYGLMSKFNTKYNFVISTKQMPAGAQVVVSKRNELSAELDKLTELLMEVANVQNLTGTNFYKLDNSRTNNDGGRI